MDRIHEARASPEGVLVTFEYLVEGVVQQRPLFEAAFAVRERPNYRMLALKALVTVMTKA